MLQFWSAVYSIISSCVTLFLYLIPPTLTLILYFHFYTSKIDYAFFLLHQQSDFDHYQVSLMMESTLAKEMSLVWKADVSVMYNLHAAISFYLYPCLLVYL